MVFFNYSTMQMAAKVVYYGPGLCGKTTNLHYIYGHTSGDSRGEMVSLETETDRTLFFDLLPIDVGQIAGFNTRIQLYTVPGQVFYNTTRKLVLKGVDGVVFVADSQRAMQQANLDSFKNLEENLTEMGLSSESLPLVLQYNKRDLADICSVDEINRILNPHGWPHFEASALTGQGVFETLKGVSKLTLLSLKKRLTRGGEGSTPTTRMAPPRPVPPLPATPASAPGAGAQPAAVPPVPPWPSPWRRQSRRLQRHRRHRRHRLRRRHRRHRRHRCRRPLPRPGFRRRPQRSVSPTRPPTRHRRRREPRRSVAAPRSTSWASSKAAPRGHAAVRRQRSAPAPPQRPRPSRADAGPDSGGAGPAATKPRYQGRMAAASCHGTSS